MLYFSKIKLLLIYLIIIFLSFFSLTNFLNDEENFILSKNINLGLDLQGGSYLLLEVDSKPLINQHLQDKIIKLRDYFKKNKIKYKKLSYLNEKIIFTSNTNDIKKFEEYFLNKDNDLNYYYSNYRSYEMEHSVENNTIFIEYTKFGLIEINNSAVNQSLEIVRRRIDEVGTKEPTIVRRGSNRILIELPGLDDPGRIKKLLGKTAKLTFRIVSEEDNEFSSELLSFEDSDEKLNISKRIVVSGDNLINANPKIRITHLHIKW